jgi:hypothetical protein
MSPLRRPRKGRGRPPEDPDRAASKAPRRRATGSRRPQRTPKPERPREPAGRRERSRPPGARSRGRSSLRRARAGLARAAPPLGKRAGAALRPVARAGGAGLAGLLQGLKVVGKLALGGLQEIGAAWLRIAELLGGLLLVVARALWPPLLAALRATRRGLVVAERVVTPERAVAVVVVAAAGVLAASQFVDYRGVEIGAPAYADVQAVAPAPQTDRETTGSVHGYAMLFVAAAVLPAVILALRGRWRAARIISLLGALAIAVSLLHDARRGLEEGPAALAYEGVQAVLIEGFWLQLMSAAVLVVTGLLLAHYARAAHGVAPRPAHRPGGRRPRWRRRRFRIAGVRA